MWRRISVFRKSRKNAQPIALTNMRTSIKNAGTFFKQSIQNVVSNVQAKLRPKPIPIEIIDFIQQPCFQDNLTPSMLDGTLIKDVQLRRYIGGGAFGRVFSASMKQSREKVTIKFIPKENDIVFDEVNFMKMLRHPNVVEFRDASYDGNYVTIAMNNHGNNIMSLSTYLHRTPDVGENVVAYITQQILSALCYCHTKGVAHMDLKSDNVIINEHLNVRIIDFGVSLAVRKPGFDVPYKEFRGTISHMSPECNLKLGYYGPECDMWSFAIMLYAMLTGHVPFGVDEYGFVEFPTDYKYPRITKYVTRKLRNLLGRLFEQQYSKRITTLEALLHPFYNQLWKMPKFDARCYRAFH